MVHEIYFSSRDSTQFYWIITGVIGGLLAGPSMRDRKLAQGVSNCTVSNAKGSTKTVIGGLGFL